MRIYNATNAQLNLPYPGGNLSIAPHSVSGNVGANTQTISLLVSAYTTDEISFIVSGPFELNLCASIPTVVNYVTQSLEEAIEKLEPKKEVVEEKVLESPMPAQVKPETVTETVSEEVEERPVEKEKYEVIRRKVRIKSKNVVPETENVETETEAAPETEKED